MKLFNAIAATAVICASFVAVNPVRAQFIDPSTGIIRDRYGIIQDIDPGAAIDTQLQMPSERRYMDDWGTILDGTGVIIDGPDPSRAPLW